MSYLLIVSIVWAFSFGLIKHHLSALDPAWVAFVRLGLSLVLFLPWWRPQKSSLALGLGLTITGAVQYGIMYLCYISSFQYLQAHQVAIFTIFTPLYVTLLHDLSQRRGHGRFWLCAALACAGSGLIVYRQISLDELGWGFLLIQGANLAFAGGQILYRQLLGTARHMAEHSYFAYLYLGAVLVSGIFTWVRGAVWTPPSLSAWLVLLYLGFIASGMGFFLWNFGARRVDAGTLSVCNNLKLPLAVLVSALVFGEQVPWLRLLAGGSLIAAALAFNLNQPWQLSKTHD